MQGIRISEKSLDRFEEWLNEREKERSTIVKYRRDMEVFREWVPAEMLPGKKEILEYKKWLLESGRQPVSANSMLAALNMYLQFAGRPELKVRQYRIQKPVFCREEKELSREEYFRLVKAAKRKDDERLTVILETICGTGIRVSELPFITVEAAREGSAVIRMKGKIRTVMITGELRKLLLGYAGREKIKSGPVVRTRSGKEVDRFTIWKQMKSLCKDAGVEPGKVFPHNLRHLFARVLYKITRDIVMVADLLGHSSVNTTRIYTVSTGKEYRRYLDRMALTLI